MIFAEGIPLGEERTFQFAKAVRLFVKTLPRIPIHRDKYRGWQTTDQIFRFNWGEL